MSELIKWLLVSLLVVNALTVIWDIGKPRQPLTAHTAIAVVLLNAAIVVAVLTYWGQP